MKTLLIYLIFPTFLFSQSPNAFVSEDRVYVGTSFSIEDNSFLILGGDSDLGMAFVRLEFRSDFDTDTRFYLKVAFKVVKRGGLGVYLAVPPMYYSIGKGYRTPFNLELRWKQMAMVNFDLYRDKFVPSLQLRIPIQFKR